MIDRRNTLTVQLIGEDMILADATLRQLAMGANRALVGNEIIQFCRATPLGGGQWRLDTLLRGRGGTEQAIANHAAGEAFVLLDDALAVLDGSAAAHSPATRVKAIGAADEGPASADILCRGLTQKPLFPVHPRAVRLADGSLQLTWVRRARAAWLWRDQVDTPLHEQSEAYEVLLGSEAEALSIWVTSAPELTIPAATVSELMAAHPGQPLIVRQRGSYASSAPLYLATLS
jgi:hypothetical protein